MIIGAGVRVWGSVAATIDNLREPSTWNAVLVEVRAQLGDAAVDAMRRKESPEPHHWDYMARLIRDQPEINLHLRDQFRRLAVAKAQEQGRLLDNKRRQLQDPDPDDFLYADGGVFGSPSRTLVPTTEDPETGEILIRRYDESRGLWYQGGITHQAAHGSKMNLVLNRGDSPATRLIMDVQHQPVGYPGGEGAMLVEMASAIKALAGGAVGLITDGILRHKHVETLADTGLIGVAPFSAYHRYQGHTTRKLMRPAPIEHGDHQHQLAYSDGAIGLYWKQNKVGAQFELLEPTRHVQTLKDGSLYVTKVVTVPCHRLGDFRHRVPISGSVTKKDGFKRNEYLRVYGEGEKAWRSIYRRRVDAEAAMRTMKRNLTDDRLPAYGPARQTLLMLLMSHAINCVSAYLHRNPKHFRTGPPEPGQGAKS